MDHSDATLCVAVPKVLLFPTVGCCGASHKQHGATPDTYQANFRSLGVLYYYLPMIAGLVPIGGGKVVDRSADFVGAAGNAAALRAQIREVRTTPRPGAGLMSVPAAARPLHISSA
jgi:hypothetical protein